MIVNKNIKVLLMSLCALPLCSTVVSAKEPVADSTSRAKSSRFYIGNALDGAIFSTATLQRPGYSNSLGTLRFSPFFNIGCTFNYDFTNQVGAYTGIDLKNIGFIEKFGDSTVKHRTYNLGIPLGVKFGNLPAKTYGFLGGGIDMPVNYKEKGFIARGHKEKFNEWFSDRTPNFMGYIFAGVAVKGVSIKLQYYLSNFLNTDYKEHNTTKIYDNYDVHLLLLSFGTVIDRHRHHNNFKMHNKKTSTTTSVATIN